MKTIVRPKRKRIINNKLVKKIGDVGYVKVIRYEKTGGKK